MALVPWNDEQKNAFIKFQFEAQHQHYTSKYPPDSFKIIELEGERVGRLYLSELADEVRIIDLTILPERRGKGLGKRIITDILKQATKPVRIYLESFNRSVGLFNELGFEIIDDEGVYQLWECRRIGTRDLTATV